MVQKAFGKRAMLVMIIGIVIGGTTNADTTTKTLFGMSCEVTRIAVSGIPTKITFDPTQYTGELATLTQKGYNRIDLIKEFIANDQTIKILLGEKCDLPVLRINQEESVNDIGVDHIERRGNKLLMYGSKDGYATLISCDLGTIDKNTYKPFDRPKQSQNAQTASGTTSSSTTGGNQSTTSISSSSGSLSSSATPLILEKKTLHPQDSFLLMRQPVSEIITFFGGDWKRDRKELAAKLNISNYRGTKEQNLQIRSYLLSYITIQIQAIETPMLELSFQEYQAAQQKVVSDLAKMRGYTRKYDRWALFQEISGDISSYRGTRSQNLQIRQNLLQKTKPKN